MITTPKKEVSQKTHIAKKKIKAENTKNQDDETTKSDEAMKFEERFAELERKIKHEAEVAATTQKGVVDAEVTALPHWNEDANAAAHQSNEYANAAATEFEHVEERHSSTLFDR